MRITFQSNLARSDKYRPDIDGLRGIAVLSVLFFHAKVAALSGGFVGVDVFFVISGYLITSIIAREVALERFSFVAFYDRRMRRIFPALFGVLFFSTIAAAVLFAPSDFSTYGKALVATTLFAGNIYLARQPGGGGYFDRASGSQALLHTWSLSVEEQFYLLFPAMLLLLARWAKGRTRGCLLLVASISFLINIWATQHRPINAFYMLVPRAWELLVGSLLAMKAVPPLNRRALREIAGLMGLGLITWAVFHLTERTTFPGLNALPPCLGAGLIIYAGEDGPSSARAILSFRPLVFVGVISYSLYLWHWPIIVFGTYFCAGNLSGIWMVAAVVSSTVMAFISFEFVERPFRGRNSAITRWQLFSLGFAASLLSVAAGLAIHLSHGFPGRYDERTRELVLRNTDRKDDYQMVCPNWKTEIKSIADIDFCKIGSDSSKKIMFWGDSHVQQLYPLIKREYDDGELRNHGVVMAIANGCPPVEHMNCVAKGFHCDSFAPSAMKRAEEEDVDTVFIGFSAGWAFRNDIICPSANGKCVEKVSLEETRRRFLQELSAEIRELKMHGKRVIVSLPFPIYDKSIPDLEVRNAVFGRFGLAGVATDLTLPSFRDQVLAVAESMGANVFDPKRSLCVEQDCVTQVNGVSIYKDTDHIAANQIGILEDNFNQVLR
jgi:peptidoglycan/LPS O-acetylase OafA/YrhL